MRVSRRPPLNGMWERNRPSRMKPQRSGRPVREALKPRIAEGLELRRHVRLAPRAQPNDHVLEPVGGKPQFGHAPTVDPGTSAARRAQG